jgi:membrane complex biogenesis BtpA family protein
MKINFTNKPIIGAVHFRTLPGFNGFTDLEGVYTSAKQDLLSLQRGGVDAVIFENNYDLPHKIIVGHETTAAMTYLITRLKSLITTPYGVSVLWNDYRSALSIAQTCQASFVRIPAFVDDVQTQYGPVFSNPTDVINYRHQIMAEDISLFTDIQVKHSQMIKANKTIQLSAKQAIISGSNGLIITGKWTGQAPDINKLKIIKNLNLNSPVIIGSGVSVDNISNLINLTDGFIVSTSLKTPSGYSLANIYDQNSRISQAKVRQLVNLRNQLLNVKI